MCNLPARTTVIAAANPVGGHYKLSALQLYPLSPRLRLISDTWFRVSRAKTVSENIKLSTALLSRFDLVFILLDSPDEQRDRFLSEHVLAVSTLSVATSLSK